MRRRGRLGLFVPLAALALALPLGTPAGERPAPGPHGERRDYDQRASRTSTELRGLVSLDLTADGRYAVIAARKDDSVSIVDLAEEPYRFATLTRRDGIGQRPLKVRAVPGGVVIVHEWDTFLAVVDPGARRVVRRVPVPLYTQDVLWDPRREAFYVSNRWLGGVLVFDRNWTPTVPPPGIAVGPQPGPMTIGPDGRLYVGNRGSWDVSVVDLGLGQQVARVYLGSRPEGLAATPDAVLVTNHGGARLERVNGVPLIQNDQVDIVNMVTAIDPATLERTERFVDRGADYTGIVAGAGLVAFAGAASGTVHLHRLGAPAGNLQTVDLLADRTLPGGYAPSGLRQFTNTRDVAIRGSEQVFAINFLRDSLVELRDLAGRFRVHGETALNPAGMPVTAFQRGSAVNFTMVQNGERYFHTLAAWKRGQRRFSCATCHPDGHSDLRMIFDATPDPFSPERQQGPERHPMALFTAVTAPYGWEGSKKTLTEFHLSALDIHDRPLQRDRVRERVHGDVAQFLTEFVKTLVAGPNPYPPPSAEARALFDGRAGCSACHPAPHFTDGKFHDVGTGRVLNTPTLLSLWDRAPYLHDGRAPTLEAIVDPATYGPPATAHGNLKALSPPDRALLVQFLLGIRPNDRR